MPTETQFSEEEITEIRNNVRSLLDQRYGKKDFEFELHPNSIFLHQEKVSRTRIHSWNMESLSWNGLDKIHRACELILEMGALAFDFDTIKDKLCFCLDSNLNLISVDNRNLTQNEIDLSKKAVFKAVNPTKEQTEQTEQKEQNEQNEQNEESGQLPKYGTAEKTYSRPISQKTEYTVNESYFGFDAFTIPSLEEE